LQGDCWWIFQHGGKSIILMFCMQKDIIKRRNNGVGGFENNPKREKTFSI
jgi:hypothetical protein